MEIATVFQVLRVAMSVLTERLMVLVAMSMTFGLAVYAVQQCTQERIILVAVFGVLVFLPTIAKESSKKKATETET